jgi:hypothetical protein
MSLEPPDDGYSLLCSKKQPPWHNNRIIGHVIHPQIFILLRLLIDVMLSCSLESVYKSKLKEKVSGFPQRF